MADPLDYAALSNAAYAGPDGAVAAAPPGWTWLDQSTPAGGPQGSANGYFAAAYQNDRTGEIVIANRGSRMDAEGLRQDWGGSDVGILRQSKDHIPKAFDDSEDFAKRVQLDNPGRPVNFTGHSLGGAHAQVQAARLDKGAQATTFGAPGVKFAVTDQQAAIAENHVTNYALPGDPVAMRGDPVGQRVNLTPSAGTVLKDVAAVTAGLLIGGPLGLLIAVVGVAATHMMSNYTDALKAAGYGSTGGPAVITPGAGMPQSRITDMHVCPMVTGIVPHVGGPIGIGCPTVLVGGLPAARVGDMAVCVGPPDAIAKGSVTVLIGGMPAARIGDMTVHGGNIIVGYPTVLTGG